jgi:ABC-2 type transport system ATP-binding protein
MSPAKKKKDSPARPAKPAKPTGLAVEVNNLTVQFGDFKAVNDVSFKVQRGEIFGFLGANGAGKTTTIRVLCGLLHPTHGKVKVAGLGLEHGANAIKAKVGYMSQKFTLYTDMSVAENLDFAAALRSVPVDQLEARKKHLFELVGFDRDVNIGVADLPGGLKQQVSLAAALLHEPEIVFLDEPTAGVAPAARKRFWAIIREVAASGRTVFVTTHYMDEAEQCGRIALMRDGRLEALDSPAGLKKLAFPAPLVEIEVGASAGADWQKQLRKHKGVVALRTHARRWHMEMSTKAAWTALKPRMPKGLKAAVIEPTLEDVFLKLVDAHPKGVDDES